MDQPAGVGGRQRREDLRADVGRPAGIESPAKRDLLLQADAVDVLHRDEGAVAEGAEVVDHDDVRMVEAGRDLGFALEALDELGIAGQVLAQDLERDGPVQAGIARAEHVRRAASSDPVEQLVAGRD